MIGCEGLRLALNHLLQHPADPRHALVLQVWTFNDRVAFVLSVTENGQPVQDGVKLQRLRQLLLRMMDEQGTGIVSIKKVGPSQPLGISCRWGTLCQWSSSTELISVWRVGFSRKQCGPGCSKAEL